MKGRSWTTAILLVCLLLAIVGALAWFQVHQHQLGQEAVAHGGMSSDAKSHFLKVGVDCLETYEMQGYEATETIFKMFNLNQHDFYSLNPGTSGGSVSIAWFWPAVAVIAAGAGFLASRLMSQQRAPAHVEVV